jgi:hypothetical protein
MAVSCSVDQLAAAARKNEAEWTPGVCREMLRDDL